MNITKWPFCASELTLPKNTFWIHQFSLLTDVRNWMYNPVVPVVNLVVRLAVPMTFPISIVWGTLKFNWFKLWLMVLTLFTLKMLLYKRNTEWPKLNVLINLNPVLNSTVVMDFIAKINTSPFCFEIPTCAKHMSCSPHGFTNSQAEISNLKDRSRCRVPRRAS